MARRILMLLALMMVPVLFASPAFACGGLIGPRGAVNLLRTTTFAGYHDGIEHYVTSFTFTGQGGGKFGSLVPLPGVPTKVERGGDWTLQRLEREVAPPVAEDAVRALSAGLSLQRAQILLEVKIDALDITVLKGGGDEVGRWATENGFVLPPDAPEVLDFYAKRSPIFMAARFDAAAARARGQLSGDGTPIHLTIPTPSPWVPLRILALGKQASELVNADVFVLTDRAPAILPAPEGLGALGVPQAQGMRLERSEPASGSLLNDLHADKGMGWVPTSDMWLSFFRIDTPASKLRNDLAIDATGAGQPSWLAAGLGSQVHPVDLVVRPVSRPIQERRGAPLALLLLGVVGGLVIGLALRRNASAA